MIVECLGVQRRIWYYYRDSTWCFQYYIAAFRLRSDGRVKSWMCAACPSRVPHAAQHSHDTCTCSHGRPYRWLAKPREQRLRFKETGGVDWLQSVPLPVGVTKGVEGACETVFGYENVRLRHGDYGEWQGT